MRLIISLLALIVSQPIVYSQQPIGGTVVDNKTGKPIEDAAVALLSTSLSIIDYTYTGSKGTFQFQSKAAAHCISINHIGYERVVISMEEFSNNATHRLEAKDYQIKEIKVTSNRIQERKDTLIYAVSGFRMPQDRSIADVLKKMPGIEVTSSGQIKFEDKAINKLYIEGMDLMGGRYALATNNLSGKVVKEVQVLRNHQSVNALRGKLFSDNAALNLVLEDAVRYTFSGNADAGMGYAHNNDLLWDARFLGLLLNKRQQNLSVYKTNNTGQNVSDELRMQIQDNDTQIASDEPILSLPTTSVGMIDEQRHLMNRSHLFATNHLYKINKETTLRGQFNYTSKRNDMQEEETTLFFYPDATVSIAEDKRIALGTDDYAAEVQYQHNGARQFIHNRLIGNLQRNDASNLLLTNHTPIHSDNLIKKKEIGNHFKWINTYRAGHVFRLSSVNYLSDLPQRLTVSPGLYEEVVNGGMPYDEFTQQVRLRSFHSHTATEFQFRVAGFYTNFDLGIDHSNQQLTSSLHSMRGANMHPTDNPDFYNDLTYTDSKLYTIPSLRYKDYRWNVRLNVPLSYHYYQLNYKDKGSKNSYPHFFVEPSLHLSYELSSLWSISNTFNYEYHTPDINKFYANYIFSTYRNAFGGNGFYYYRSLVNGTTLKFNSPLNGIFGSLSGMIVPTWQNKMFSYKQDGVLNAGEMVDKKHQSTQWNLRTRLSKSFGIWKLFVGFTGHYNENRDKSLLSDVAVPFKSQSLLLALDFSMQPSKYISIEGNGKFLYSNLSSNITQRISSEYYRNSLSVNLFPAPNWKLRWDNLSIIGNEPIHSSVYFMDARASYSFKRIEVELSIRNLLNKQDFKQTMYASMSESQTANYFRPREVLLKCMVAF